MSVQYLRNENTGALIVVEVPPSGLHKSYTRAGWVPCDPPAPKADSKSETQPSTDRKSADTGAEPDDKNRE